MTFLTLNKKKTDHIVVCRSYSHSLKFRLSIFYEVALTGLISSTASSIPVFALMYIR